MNENEKLIMFARKVLGILENNIEWSTDTLDEIGDIAYRIGLAHTDSDTYLFTADVETH